MHVISESISTDSELGLEFVATLWNNMRFLQGSSSFSLAVFQSESAVGCVRMSLSFAATPGSFVYCVLVVQVYAWVWPGVGCGISGEVSCYYSTRGWGRLKTRSPFDTSSSEYYTFVTCLDLFRFPHWFVKILCSWVWLISLTTCWCVLFWGGGSWLDFFYVVLLTLTDTTQRSPEVDHGHGATVTVPCPMSGVQFATETYRTGFQKKDHGEDCESRRKSYLFSKVFVTNLQFDQVRFFFNVSEVSIFFGYSHSCLLGHTGGVRREVRKRPARRYSRNGPWT